MVNSKQTCFQNSQSGFILIGFLMVLPALAIAMALYYQVSLWTQMKADVLRTCRDQSLDFQAWSAREISQILQSMNSETQALHEERRAAEAQAVMNPALLAQILIRQRALDARHSLQLNILRRQIQNHLTQMVRRPVWLTLDKWNGLSVAYTRIHWGRDGGGELPSIQWNMPALKSIAENDFYVVKVPQNYMRTPPGIFYEPNPKIFDVSRLRILVQVTMEPAPSQENRSNWIRQVQLSSFVEFEPQSDQILEENQQIEPIEFDLVCSSSLEEVEPMIQQVWTWQANGVLRWGG